MEAKPCSQQSLRKTTCLFLCAQLPTYIRTCACLYRTAATQIYFKLSVAGHIISIFNTTTESFIVMIQHGCTKQILGVPNEP